MTIRRLANKLNALFQERSRRSADLYLSLAGLAVLLITGYIAGSGVPAWEVSVFRDINGLPDWIFPIVWPFMQYGVFITIPVVSIIALFYKKYRLAIMMLLGGVGIYFLALVVKNLVDRGRPADILADPIVAHETFRAMSLGFTSGHAAVAATIATFAHRYLSGKLQILSLVTLAVVAFGRIYIGGHLPLDVVGGLALGVAVASLLNYVVGAPKHFEKVLEPVIKLVREHRPRHPGDIVRAIMGAALFLGATVLAWGQHISQIEEAVFRVVNYLPSLLSPVITVIMQTGALYFVPIAAAWALIFKHPRLALKITFGGPTVWFLAKLAKALVERDRPFYILSGIVERASNSGILGFPSGHAAVAALLATVASPYLKKSWSRTAWILVWIVALSRLYVGAHLPLDVIAGLTMGWVFGSLLNLLLGTPGKPVPRKALRQKLIEAGFSTNELADAHVDARGSAPLTTETPDGQKLFIKVIDNEHRNADVLYKAWRYFTLREVEDEAPFSTAKHLVEHEAYLYDQATKAGVKAPSVYLAVPITAKAAALVAQRIDGVTLDRYEGSVTPVLLDRIWKELAKMQSARIAHRDLRSANVMIDSRGQPWLIDFSFAVQAASARHMTTDIVELLVSLSLSANPAKVVRSAINVLGTARVKDAYPYLQSAALTSVTRRQAKAKVGLLEEVRRQVRKQTKLKDLREVHMYRFSTRVLLWLILGAGLAYFVIAHFGDIDDYAGNLASINLLWMLGILVASIGTYMASAFVVLGASREPLPYGSSVLLQLATSFVNRITPRSLGGIAITERFLENKGLTRVAAFSSVSLMYFAGMLVHIFLLAIVVLGFVQHPVNINFPSGWQLIAGILIALTAVGIGFISKFKKKAIRYIKEAVRSVRHGFTAPIKVGQLFGGSAALTILYSTALYSSIHAFGVSLPFDEVLFVFLAGSAIASAAPTPGGLGAVEAALVGGLLAFGMDATPAVASVLAYRLFTYWLPIIPGYIAFRHLQREHLL
jgi:undecaprenyl-diphosphatase